MTALETAQDYISRGMAPLPIPYGSKGPILRDWQMLRITRESAPRYFNGARLNIGVLLGAPSNGLVDLDLDCPQAVTLASSFLPPTNSVFGREGNPRSHWLYRAAGASTAKFVDPHDKEMMIELRADGAQTVFPGSVHPSGELVEWVEDDDPAEVDAGQLRLAVGRLAAAVMLARAMPEKGRHDLLLALSGGIVRAAGADMARCLLLPVGRLALQDRGRSSDTEINRMIAGASERLAKGDKVPGWPALTEALGEKRTKALGDWLGLKPGTAAAPIEAPIGHAGDAIGWQTEVARLARLAPLEAAMQRKAVAKMLGVPAAVLDKEVKKRRHALAGPDGAAPGSGRPLKPEPQPWVDPSEPERPTIDLEAKVWNERLREGARLVADRIYLRGTMAVVVTAAAAIGREADEGAVEVDGVRHRPGAMILAAATPVRCQYRLNEAMTFRKFDRRSNEWRATPCPADFATQLVENAADLSAFRACEGVAHVPLLRDGAMVERKGWDAATGIILDLRHGPLQPIPEHPTKENAAAALKVLLRPFRGYLGRKTVTRCALASSALTAVARPSLATAPAILLDANTPGAGKGLIARMLGVLATSDLPAIITEGPAAEEFEKRIASALLQGSPAIVLDNLQKAVASSTLESFLTEGTADIRLFGRIDATARVRGRPLILMTANNASLRRDLLRRVLPVRICVADENPEQRNFTFDPVAEVMRDRPALLAAAFTILRAWWVVRDAPANAKFRKPLGSFDDWADLVAGAVAWLTGENPIDLIAAAKAEDPKAAGERAVIAALFERFKTEPWAARDAAVQVAADIWEGAGIAVKGEERRVSALAVGHWLRARKDRAFGKHALRGETNRNGVVEWCLKPHPAGDAGDSRDDSYPTRELAERELKTSIRGSKTKKVDVEMTVQVERAKHPPYPPHPRTSRPRRRVRGAVLSAARLVAEVRAHGARVVLDGDDVVLKGRVPAELVARCRRAKPELVAALTDPPPYIAQPPLGLDQCRWCKRALDWARPGPVAFGDDGAGCLPCYHAAVTSRRTLNRHHATEGMKS